MTGHWICDRCGYDGEHADYCVYLRPMSEQWKGHRTTKEMDELKNKQLPHFDYCCHGLERKYCDQCPN